MVQFVLSLPSGENCLVEAATTGELLSIAARYASAACVVSLNGVTVTPTSPLPPPLSTLTVRQAATLHPQQQHHAGGQQEQPQSSWGAAVSAGATEAGRLTRGFLETALHGAAWRFGMQATGGQVLEMGAALVGMAAASAGLSAAKGSGKPPGGR